MLPEDKFSVLFGLQPKNFLPLTVRQAPELVPVKRNGAFGAINR